jgi:hypothetical protein
LVTRQQRVTVRSGFGYRAGAEHAASAAFVLDNDGLPRRALNRSATTRDSASVPPAAKGTTKVIGRVG